jgi:CHAT domain-containing protein
MVDPGTRPRSWTGLALTLILGLLASACQSAMSLEEAKKVTATFRGASFVPPPRTINDLAARLDHQAWPPPEAAVDERKFRADLFFGNRADANTTDLAALAEFYLRRARAAREVGRFRQEIDDLTKASAMETPISRNWVTPFWMLKRYAASTELYAKLGDVKAAEAALDDFLTASKYRFYGASLAFSAPPAPPVQWRFEAWLAQAQAAVLDAKGESAEAEALYRKLFAVVSVSKFRESSWLDQLRSPYWQKVLKEKDGETWLEQLHAQFALNLLHQGRLLEAENETREAVLGMVAKRGRNSLQTAFMLGRLSAVLLEQGRYQEAKRLARASLATFEKVGAPADSVALADVRRVLAIALEAQGRDQEARREYETIRASLSGEPGSLETLVIRDFDYAEVLLKTGQADRALEPLTVALERSQQLVGAAHQRSARIRSYMARAYAAHGDTARALHEFRAAMPLLLARSPDVDDEATNSRLGDRRLVDTLTSYIGLLADIRGTPFERAAGIDAMAEAFRLADVARGRSVQRALNASAVRAAVANPALADLVRRKQDAAKHITALTARLADLLSPRSDQPDPTVVQHLRAEIDVLRRARAALTTQIEKEFPAYAELINPRPLTVDQARALLRPGEALIATLVTRDRTFVWAIPASGPVAFAAVPMGAQELEQTVATLRQALEPRATTLEDIPEFDLALAYRLYGALLEPVRSAWHDARSLLVVAHGPLSQLPLVVLPTEPVTLPAQSGVTFSHYRHVPWLVRSHAVTMLPSVTALGTLRTMPPGDPSRRSFVGFGDPYFSREQAAAARAEATRAAAAEGPSRSQSRPAEVVALTTRGIPIVFRGSPQAFDSAQLGKLPRLPDTAEEIRSIATVTNADLTRDVFLGARANERSVQTLDLARYRVVAFATHGLVPGDLDGLTQPALALSAPDVAGIDGDGLLTLDKILGLRLNADWIVLSACNTASGQGAGAEAISGLGRAFFYAGARALLVSHWPVETTSARALTTNLFRRQQQDPSVSRTQALQQTLNWLIDRGTFVDAASGQTVFSYAHPIFWAPFILIGDGSSEASAK